MKCRMGKPAATEVPTEAPMGVIDRTDAAM
jgi:hypothetical protein